MVADGTMIVNLNIGIIFKIDINRTDIKPVEVKFYGTDRDGKEQEYILPYTDTSNYIEFYREDLGKPRPRHLENANFRFYIIFDNGSRSPDYTTTLIIKDL